MTSDPIDPTGNPADVLRQLLERTGLPITPEADEWLQRARGYCAEPVIALALSIGDLDRLRQWYNVGQDLAPKYLDSGDQELAQRIARAMGWETPGRTGALPADQLDLLRRISTYDGSDRTETGTPQDWLARALETRGLIKAVTLGDGYTVWKMTGRGLEALKP